MKIRNWLFKMLSAIVLIITLLILPNARSVLGASETLLFFDEFDGTALDTDLWNFTTHPNNNAQAIVGGGLLTLHSGVVDGSGGTVVSKETFTSGETPLVLEMHVQHSADDGGHWGFQGDNGNGIAFFEASSSGDLLATIVPCNPGCSPSYITIPDIDITLWHTYRIELTVNAASFYIDNVLVGIHTIGVPQDKLLRVNLDRNSRGENQTLLVDYVELLAPVPNRPPSANAGGPYYGDEGGFISLNGSVSDPDGDPLAINWTVDSALCSFSNPADLQTSITCTDDGTYMVTLTAGDGVNDPVISPSTPVAVNNVAPTIALSGADQVDEGSLYTLTLGAVTDPGDDVVTQYIVNWGDDNTDTYSTGGDVTHTYLDGDSTSKTIIVDLVDEDGTYLAAGSKFVTVNNLPPTIESIVTPIDPIAINNQPVSVEVAFSDPGTADTHAVTWNWGDSNVDTQSDAVSPASQEHTYAEAGVYMVQITVTDDDGGTADASYEFIVIFDPDGGFVTGGGWINSPKGACNFEACTYETTGKATFGFVSKYKKGADVPTGQTQFQFKAGNLNFHSDVYDWLVVAGPHAKFKGTGTINGSGTYSFMVTATDGDVNGGGGTDGFRIKIQDAGGVVYDNKMGASDDSDDTTAIGGGSIVIHKAK